MKTRSLGLLLVALFALPALAGDLNGVWTGSIADPRGGKHELTINLKVDGDTVTGTFAGGPPAGEEQALVNGKLLGDQLSFDLLMKGPRGEDIVAICKAKMIGTGMQGTHKTPMGTLAWEATKE